jgi:tetratricopeptide (TPR) repeat protein
MVNVHKFRTVVSWLFRPPVVVLRGLGRYARRHPLRSLLAGLLVLGLGTATGLYFWSGARLRAADRALRTFDREQAERQLHYAWPFRKHWDPDAPFLAARLARMNSQFPEAAEHLQACQRMEGATARVQLEFVLLRALQGHLDEVEPGLWNCILAGDPDTTFILEVLAGMNMRALQWSRALGYIQKWLELEPNNAEAWEWQGWVFDRLFRQDDAENSYRRCIEIEPKRERARFWLAELYLGRFKVPEAVPLIEQLLREQPDHFPVLSVAGQLRFLQGRLEEAVEFFDRAYALEPKNADIPVHRARLELQAGRNDGAELWARRALALNERNSEVRFLLYQALKGLPGREKDAAEALALHQKYQALDERFSVLLRELIPAHPGDPKYAAELADLLFLAQQPDKAVYWHMRALQIDPEFVPSHRALAEHFEKIGRPKEASVHRSRLPATKKNP